MGCLNSEGQFDHWFGNIHLSGPCNRSCYFCIGQHMMALDALNVLDTWPLPSFDKFIAECKAKKIREVNLTGSNTDPLLYKHLVPLTCALKDELHNVELGIRTNAVSWRKMQFELSLFNKISVSVTSFDPAIYRKTMGSGDPPNLAIMAATYPRKLKLNVVLCPETVDAGCDLMDTLQTAAYLGIGRVNIREPYGQPHIGDPLARWGYKPYKQVYGMPCYSIYGHGNKGHTQVTYWDVHYVEVESVNLYASGRVSVTYPVTKGCAADGMVQGQEQFKHSGRVREQWVN